MQADAVLHFGTHGSLEFMPGKQVGMSGVCYPDSLIGDLPNLYYYAANNPSEATIAKRRSYANTISYLTPPAENAGLYKGLKVGHSAHMPAWSCPSRCTVAVYAAQDFSTGQSCQPKWPHAPRPAWQKMQARCWLASCTIRPSLLALVSRLCPS